MITFYLSSINSQVLLQSNVVVLQLIGQLCVPMDCSMSDFPITVSQSFLKLMSIELEMPSNHLILCCPLLLPSVLPASGSFPMSWLFTSGGQSIGVSASDFPMNIQARFPLGLTSLISFQSKRLSRAFSSTTIQKHQFFSTQPSLWSNFHIYT